MPNISIYDFARGLAVHANLREPEVVPFSPHEGRLLELKTCPENLQWASKGGTVYPGSIPRKLSQTRMAIL